MKQNKCLFTAKRNNEPNSHQISGAPLISPGEIIGWANWTKHQAPFIASATFITVKV